MSILDKRNLLPELEDSILELGCGPRKRIAHSIGIDIINYDCVDIVGDIYEVLHEVKNQSIGQIHSHHFFEHVHDVELLMSELARILKSGGIVQITVPHFSNPYHYSDFSHRNTFGLYSFSYFARDSLFRKKVPHYTEQTSFVLEEARLVFKSSPPFYFRHAIKKILQVIFNLNRYAEEFYEENCCYFFPCYEFHFRLRRD